MIEKIVKGPQQDQDRKQFNGIKDIEIQII